jgi:hypothetical protein
MVGVWGIGRVEALTHAGRGGGTAEWAARNREEEAKAKVPARVINRAQDSLSEPNFSDESEDGKNASAFQFRWRKTCRLRTAHLRPVVSGQARIDRSRISAGLE